MRRRLWSLSIAGFSLGFFVFEVFAQQLSLPQQLTPQPCPPQIREHPESPLLQRESYLVIGNKGEEQLRIGADDQCQRDCWVFDHAEIEIDSLHFGSAQFVSLPPAGCRDCGPIQVRWYTNQQVTCRSESSWIRNMVLTNYQGTSD